MNSVKNLPQVIEFNSDLLKTEFKKKELSKKECYLKIKEMISPQNSEEALFYRKLIKKRDFTILTKEIVKNPQHNDILQFLINHSNQLAIRKYTSFKDGNFMDIAYLHGNHKAVEIFKGEGLRRSIFGADENEAKETECLLRDLFEKKDNDYFDEDKKDNNFDEDKKPFFKNFVKTMKKVGAKSQKQKNKKKQSQTFEKIRDESSILTTVSTNWSGKIPEDITVLQLYVTLGKINIVRKMIQKGMPVNEMQDRAFHLFPRRAIHCAIDAEFPKIAKLLIKNGAKDCLANCSGWWGKVKYKLPHHTIKENHQGITQLTALHMAIMNEMPDIVKLLLEKAGSDVNQCASGLISPMHLAIKKKDTEMIQILLTYRGTEQLYREDEFGYTPLDHMQMNQSYELLEVIMPFLTENNNT